MSKRPQADFEAILEESGVPVTEEALEAELKKKSLALVVRYRMILICHRFGAGFVLQS